MVREEAPSAESDRKEDSSEMVKACAMPLLRFDDAAPIRAANDPIVSRFSNDFEGIIERIENLRLARDRETEKRREGFDRKTHDSTDRKRSNDRRGTTVSGAVVAPSCQTFADDDRERLVERGPIKSQLVSTARDRPYWTTGDLIRSLKTNETFVLDYDETAEQIFRDKEYSEKLNACLDQLQDAARTVWNSYGDDKDRNASETRDSNATLAFGSTIVADPNEPSEDTLLEILSHGAFQPAQQHSESNFLGSSETSTAAWQHDCLIGGYGSSAASRSESRGSSCAECPQTSRLNLTGSPVGSPRVTAPTYAPLQLVSSSSNSYSSAFSSSSSSSSSFSSSFSSSSNQSYGDTPSPIGYQVPFGSRIGERLGEDLENLSFWNDASESFAISGINNCKTADVDRVPGNAETADVVDTIDNNELQLVEEVLRGLGEEKSEKEKTRERDSSKSENVASLFSFVSPIAGPESVGKDSICERYGKDSAVSPDREEQESSSATRRNLPDGTMPDVEAAVAADRATDDESRVDAGQLAPFDGHRKRTFDSFRPNKWTDARDDFEIPKMVACFESSSSRRARNSDRNIMPWPSLNLPSVRASERLKECLNPKEVEKAMSSLLKRSVEELAKQDEDGDTILMCLVGNPDELANKRAYLAPLVERLSIARGALSVTNNRGEDALYLAALNCPRFSYVTGYLAATMVQKGIDVSQRLYHTRGDTLIHSVAAQGDSHGEILAELLALKTVQGNAVFDLSKRNYDGRTALHVAVQAHDPSTRGIASVAIVNLLLKHGADPTIKETKCGDTALHMAVALSCDPALVKVLLATRGSDLANATNYNHDTPLHVAAATSNTVPLERQREVFWLLIHAGGSTNLPNRQGKTPLALVSPERKTAIRKIIYKRY